MNIFTKHNITLFNSIAVFAFFALSLYINKGFNYPAILLLGATIIYLIRHRKWTANREDLWLITALLLMAGVDLINAIRMNGGAGYQFEVVVRFLLAIAIYLYLSAYPIKSCAIWLGSGFGAIGGLLLTGKIILAYAHAGTIRVSGYLNAIQFGNIAVLLSIICLCGLARPLLQQKRFFTFFILVLGLFSGLLTSLFSDSRGGWVAFLLTICVLAYFIRYKITLDIRLFSMILMVGFILGAVFWSVRGKEVKVRIQQVHTEINLYLTQGNDNTSIGARLSMWKFALHEGMTHPIFGANTTQMKIDKAQWVKEGHAGEVIVHYGHLHNELLDAFATKGLLGVLALLALYGLPLFVFLKKRTLPPDDTLFALKMTGIAIITMHIGFGLTQTALHFHSSGFMMFILPLVFVYAAYQHRLNTLQTNPSP